MEELRIKRHPCKQLEHLHPMFPTKWTTLTGILFMFGTIKAFLVPWVHEAVPYYDQSYHNHNEQSIPSEMINEENNINGNSELPIITVVKKPKQTLSEDSKHHSNIFWRTARNKNDPVLVFSTLLNHQWLNQWLVISPMIFDKHSNTE